MNKLKLALGLASIISFSAITGCEIGNYLTNRKIKSDSRLFTETINSIIDDNSTLRVFGKDGEVYSSRTFQLKNGFVFQTENSLLFYITEVPNSDDKKIYVNEMCALADRTTGKLTWLSIDEIDRFDPHNSNITAKVYNQNETGKHQKEFNKILKQICDSYYAE